MSQNDSTFRGDPNQVLQTLKEIERQKKSRRDYIVTGPALSVDDKRSLVFTGRDTFAVEGKVFTEWADAEIALDAVQREGGKPDAKIIPLGKAGAIPLKRTAERQLADKLGIPIKYVDALHEGQHSDLAAHNFTTLLARTDKKLMVRTLDNQVRAVLSNGYRILDNCDVFFAAADELDKAKAFPWHARLWDDGFELLAVSSTLHEAIARDFQKHAGEYHHWTPRDSDGDIHNAAARIRNSETGCGGLNVDLCMFSRACNNTLVWQKGLAQIHLGRRQEEGAIRYAEDTQEAEAHTVWLKLRDTIRAAFDPEKFAEAMDGLRGLTTRRIANPEKAVERVAESTVCPKKNGPTSCGSCSRPTT